MSSLKAKGYKAFIWDFLGKIAGKGMGFIISIFLARLLEPSDFGLIAIVMVIIGMATVFSDIGLSGAIIQRRRTHSIHYSSVFYFNIFAGSFLTLLTYFSASWISEFYNNEQLLPLLQVMSLSFVIGAFSSVQNARLRKELNYKLLTKISLASTFSSGTLGVLLAFWGAGVWSLVVQFLVMGIVHNILIWTATKWVPGFAFSWKALTQLWGFGFRMFLSRMLDEIYMRLDYLIIGKLFAPATLGYFQRAKSLDNMVTQYSSASLMAVLFPILSKVQQDLPRFQNIIIKALGIVCFIAFLLLGALYLISEELIVLLFSDKWLPSVEFFKILVLSGFAYPISAVLVNVLSSRGNSKGFLRLEIYKKLIGSSSLLVLYFYGINAFLYSLIVLSVLGVSINILFASREIDLPFFQFARPILTQAGITFVTVVSTLLMTQNIELANIMMLIIKGGLFTIIYVLLNYILRTSSFQYFLEQIMPVIRKKLGKKDE